MPHNRMMASFIPLVCLLSIVATCAERSTLFKTPLHNTYGWRKALGLQQRPARSALECASFCSAWDDCLTFHFASGNSTCMLTDKAISEADGKVYGVRKKKKIDCPSQFGYKFYRRGDIKLCLRPVDASVRQYTARNGCTVNGGHLLLVENEEIRLLAASIQDALGIDNCWIDGKDYNGDKKYTNWKGETITFYAWDPPDPGGPTENCMGMQKAHGYRYRDGPCTGRYWGYICQMN